MNLSERLLILFASQTGQALAIAEQIFQKCQQHLDVLTARIAVECFCLDQTEKRFCLDQETTVIFVVSTTGEGEPPESACRFFRRLKRKTLKPDHLSNLWYTILALGDSNFDRFANFGQELDRRLQQLGASKFYETGFGDDGVGLELGVEPWIDGLFPAVLCHYKVLTVFDVPKIEVSLLKMDQIVTESDLTTSCPPLSELTKLTLPNISSKFGLFEVNLKDDRLDEKSFFFSQLPVMDSDIFDATIVGIKELSKSIDDKGDELEAPEKMVLEATFKLENNKSLLYEPGDSFGFICGNSDEETNEFLQRLSLLEKADFLCEITANPFKHLPVVVKLSDLFKYYLEVRSVPSKSCLRHFADFCTDPSQKRRLLELSSREGAEDFTKFMRNQSVGFLDILKVFDSCKPSIEAILSYVPGFLPRYYSVVNFPKSDNLMKVAFTVVNNEPICCRRGTQLNGVFTGRMFRLFQKLNKNIENSLSDLTISKSNTEFIIKMFKRKNAHFKLPKNATTPLILVGPGTGVAPFIGFLEARKKFQSENVLPIGETWLFFGCRRPDQDFIYENELKDYRNNKTLTQLCVCFSRQTDDNNSPNYVQDLILKNSKHIHKLIKDKKAFIFVCGDVKMMSVNVFNAFVKIFEEAENLTHADAVKLIRNLQEEKRYLQDVWI